MQVLISSAKYDSTNNPKLTCYFQKTFSKYGVILNVFPVIKPKVCYVSLFKERMGRKHLRPMYINNVYCSLTDPISYMYMPTFKCLFTYFPGNKSK